MASRAHIYFQQFTVWLLQEKHKQKAWQIRDEVEKAFTDHPTETGETYFEHLWFTIKISFRFILVSLVLLTHGLFPFLFMRTASVQIERIYVIMKSRIPKLRRDFIDEHYDI